jgi:hypothetical protein
MLDCASIDGVRSALRWVHQFDRRIVCALLAQELLGGTLSEVSSEVSSEAGARSPNRFCSQASEGMLGDAWAHGGDEGRGKLR